jgi:thiamine-phosphate pyrophosphorylase
MRYGQFQLCYITDRHGLPAGSVGSRIQEAVRAGVDLIQVREKDLPTRDLAALAEAAVRFSRGTTTRVVINDRLDIAMGAGADGVHLGGESLPPEVARAQAGADFLIGVSCHSLEEALRAAAGEANYVLLGPVFETPSKLAYGPPLGLDKLAEAVGRLEIPVIALGGITVERIKGCFAVGAAGVAGIRIFQDCASLEERVLEMRSEFHS